MGCSTFYDSLYVDLALVKRDHGEIVATDLFNYADFYTFNPFELRGAARLIADGWEIPEIANHLIEHGGEESFCEYTPEEETESEALLWLFQNKKKDFGDLGLSDPSPQEHGMEMGCGAIFILDFVASTVMDNLIDWFYGQVVGFLGNFFAEMGNMGVELFDLDWVQAIVLFFSQLGWARFGVCLVVCIFECGSDYATGRANIKDTALNVLKGSLAVCLFTTVPVRLLPLPVPLQGPCA